MPPLAGGQPWAAGGFFPLSGCNLRASRYNGARLLFWQARYGGPVGPPATISRKPGQARKGAAIAVTLCAGVWLAVVAT